MAGILQTGTLVDGQWMTRNVDMITVLEGQNQRPASETQSEADNPPELGLLTQTVINSPLIRWILPAKIRSFEYYDVAFVGDNSVQLRRLDHNGTLHYVARKADFGSRIRNACVVGSSDIESEIPGDTVPTNQTRDQNGDISMEDATSIGVVPPQFILLALETGDLLFLFARNTTKGVEFITSSHQLPVEMIEWQGGKHLTVDPSSRYMATAGSENVFAVYALNSKEEFTSSFVNGEAPRPILSEKYIPVKGVIHKMEFLYPSVDDPDHIILVLLIARGASSVLYVYEWAAGQSLSEIRCNNLQGHPVANSYRMPLLFIPLRFKSVFLLVGVDYIGECHYILEGSPDIRPLNVGDHEASPMHLGTDKPLWTAWTRPPRTQSYLKTHDDIYIIREDGLVIFMEIRGDLSPEANLLETSNLVGRFGNNVGTAFANLDAAVPGPDGGDFLVTSGDTGDGGSYLVAARDLPNLVETIPSWTPTVDFVTAASPKGAADQSFTISKTSKERKLVSAEPDRIFLCTGREHHGAVSEIRYGCEARIRLDVAGLDVPITDMWVLPLMASGEDRLGLDEPAPLLFLLSMVDRSMLLHLTADWKEIEEVHEPMTWLDLTSRTLAAAACNGLIIQVTERSVSASFEQAMMRNDYSLPTTYREEYENSIIVAASIYRDEIAVIVTKSDDGDFQLICLRIKSNETVDDDVDIPYVPSVEVFGNSVALSQYPNSISIVRHSNGSVYAIIGAAECNSDSDVQRTVKSDVSLLPSIFKLESTFGLVKINNHDDNWHLDPSSFFDALPEACVSIANLRGIEADPREPELFLAGYRSGLLVMRRYRMTQAGIPEELKTSQYQVGSTPLTLKVDPAIPNMALISCDEKLWTIRYNYQSNDDPILTRVWFTDIEQPLHLQPLVNHVSILPQGLLLSAGKRLLVSSLHPQPRPIPRKIALNGTPYRILYSHHFNKLIVAMSVKGRSTIRVIDPETGKMTSNYHDAVGNQLKFPLGLGIYKEKILCLVEWQWDPKTQTSLIIAGTSEGSLMIYRIRSSGLTLGNGELSIVPFLEAHYGSPVYAVVPCKMSFFYCIDQKVRWATVNGSQDKLLTRAEYNLPSRAVSMSVDGHWLNILTVQHSLITLLLVDRKKHTQLAADHGQFVPQFSDGMARDGLDQIILKTVSDDPIDKDSTVIMVSDKDCAVAGLWYNRREQLVGRDCKRVLEADLPSSIIKFRFGKVRPPWDQSRRPSRVAMPTHFDGDLLGLGIDGSITHFTLLDAPLFRLLKFLQFLIRRARDVAFPPQITKPVWHDKDPGTRHINGELLRPILAHRSLEQLLVADATDTATDSLVDEFCSFVNQLQHEDVSVSAPVTDKPFERSLEEAYRILEYVLRPIL